MPKTGISGNSLDFKAYSAKSLDFQTDPDFTIPLYNVWTFAKKHDFCRKCLKRTFPAKVSISRHIRTHKTVSNEIETFGNFETVTKITKSLDFQTDPDFTPPLYNVWTFAKKYDYFRKCPF